MPDLTKIEKGTKLQVSGRIRAQRYTDSDGIERFGYEVLASAMSPITDTAPFQYEFSC